MFKGQHQQHQHKSVNVEWIKSETCYIYSSWIILETGVTWQLFHLIIYPVTKQI